VIEQEITKFIKQYYRLVLLTQEESERLNQENRSKMSDNRLDGIIIHKNG
jgi:hypothetical protein